MPKKKKVVKPTPAPAKRGPPFKFNDVMCAHIMELAELGLTDKQIAEEIGVGVRTLGMWKLKYPNFRAELKDAKLVADEFVEASLFQRACGYSHKAVKIFLTKTGETIEHEYIERYPPDTSAAIFWLKNRQPQVWRDKHEIEVSEDQKKIETLNDTELDQEIARHEKEKKSRDE